MRDTLRDVGLGIVIGLIAAAAVCAWQALRPSAPALPGATAPEVAAAPTTTLDCQPVRTFPGHTVKKRVGLPADAVRDPARHLTAATRVPGDEHPHTVSALYNERTGITDLYVRRDPLPWLETRPRWSLTADVGALDGEGTWHAAARYDALRVKGARLGAAGHVFGTDAWYAGVGLEVSW